MRLRRSGTVLLHVRWDETTDALTQLAGNGVALDPTSDAEGQNVRKVRLTLVLRIDPGVAGGEALVEALATDDDGRIQEWDAIGTLRIDAE